MAAATGILRRLQCKRPLTPDKLTNPPCSWAIARWSGETKRRVRAG